MRFLPAAEGALCTFPGFFCNFVFLLDLAVKVSGLLIFDQILPQKKKVTGLAAGHSLGYFTLRT